jgi:hypothetical protein
LAKNQNGNRIFLGFVKKHHVELSKIGHEIYEPEATDLSRLRESRFGRSDGRTEKSKHSCSRDF